MESYSHLLPQKLNILNFAINSTCNGYLWLYSKPLWGAVVKANFGKIKCSDKSFVSTLIPTD